MRERVLRASIAWVMLQKFARAMQRRVYAEKEGGARTGSREIFKDEIEGK